MVILFNRAWTATIKIYIPFYYKYYIIIVSKYIKNLVFIV